MILDGSRGIKRRHPESDTGESSHEDLSRRSSKRPRIFYDDAVQMPAPYAPPGVVIMVAVAAVNHRPTARRGEVLIRLRATDTAQLRAAIAAVPSDSDDRTDGVQVYAQESDAEDREDQCDREESADDESGNDVDDGSDAYDELIIVVRAWGADAAWRRVAITIPELGVDATHILVRGRAADAVRHVTHLIASLATPLSPLSSPSSSEQPNMPGPP